MPPPQGGGEVARKKIEKNVGRRRRKGKTRPLPKAKAKMLTNNYWFMVFVILNLFCKVLRKKYHPSRWVREDPIA